MFYITYYLNKRYGNAIHSPYVWMAVKLSLLSGINTNAWGHKAAFFQDEGKCGNLNPPKKTPVEMLHLGDKFIQLIVGENLSWIGFFG